MTEVAEAPKTEAPERKAYILPGNKLWLLERTNNAWTGTIDAPDVRPKDFEDPKFVSDLLSVHTSGQRTLRLYDTLRLIAEPVRDVRPVGFILTATVDDVQPGYVRLTDMRVAPVLPRRDAQDFALPPGFTYTQDWTVGTWSIVREKDGVTIVTERTKADALRELLNHATLRTA